GQVNPYVQVARLDHWFKNLFMLPGFLLAWLFTNITVAQSIGPALTALLSTCLIASANYVINEWLDAEYDRHHPVKSSRPAVTGKIQAHYVFVEYVLLIAGGLFLASRLHREFMVFSI